MSALTQTLGVSPSPDHHPNVTPASQLTTEEMAAIVDAERRHVDYNLHPLRVQGLGHYIDAVDGSERFRIS